MATRRKFIKNTVVISAGVALYGCGKGEQAGIFTKSERDCLIAMAEQFIPRDEFAGATDAGVINYIENWAGKYYPEILPLYKESLASMQKASQKLHSKDFQSLDFKTQTEFLKLMEAGKLAGWGGQKGFFDEILERTMQGFYGSPRHGGNKNNLSFKMLKLDMPLVIGQNRYGRVS